MIPGEFIKGRAGRPGRSWALTHGTWVRLESRLVPEGQASAQLGLNPPPWSLTEDSPVLTALPCPVHTATSALTSSFPWCQDSQADPAADQEPGAHPSLWSLTLQGPTCKGQDQGAPCEEHPHEMLPVRGAPQRSALSGSLSTLSPFPVKEVGHHHPSCTNKQLRLGNISQPDQGSWLQHTRGSPQTLPGFWTPNQLSA